MASHGENELTGFGKSEPPHVRNMIQADKDRIIASYSLLTAVRRLDVRTLRLKTPDYLPEVHYEQVRDAWHGLRTPSGR